MSRRERRWLSTGKNVEEDAAVRNVLLQAIRIRSERINAFLSETVTESGDPNGGIGKRTNFRLVGRGVVGGHRVHSGPIRNCTGSLTMLLTPQQRCELLAKHGCYATVCCDRCGRLLGPVRFTRRGDAGVWCSPECRGDEQRRAIRRGGRPRKYVSVEQRRTVKTTQQRIYRSRPRVEKTPSQIGRNKELTDAKNNSLALHHSPDVSRLKSPLMLKSNEERFPQTA